MGRRKNSFSKAIKHLKSTSIDEKIEMLNEIPTMNTGAIYSVVPNSTTVGFDVTTSETNPDYSTIDFDIDGEDGKDTSGLFDNSGNSKFVSPPGDNSYILGPMSAMYYGWSFSSPTRIGYIRESDRRMVNLASLSVKLNEWDGDPSKFTSYGQLTLEQALWFKDIGKKDGDSTHYGNYRAFYPGPPSGGSDAFGRYLAIIVGIPVATSTTTTTTSHLKAPMDQQGSDNFSGILDRLKKLGGKGIDAITALGDFAVDPLGSITDFVKNDLVDLYDKFSDTTLSNDVLEPAFEKFGQFIGSKSGFVLGIVTTAANDIRSYIGGRQSEFGDRPAFSSSNNQFAYAVNLAMSLAQSIGNGRPVVMDNSVVSSQAVAQNISVDDITMMHETNQTFQNGMPNIGMGVDDILNPNKDDEVKKPYMGDGFGGEGGSIMTPFIDNKGDLKISNVGDKVLRLGGESGEGFDINTQTFTDIPSSGNAMGIVDEMVNSGKFADGLTKLFNQQTNDANYNSALVDNITNTVINSPTYQNLMTVLDNDTIGGSFVSGSSTGAVNGAAAGALLYNQIKVKLGLIKPTALQNAGGYGHVRRETIIDVNDLKPKVKNKLNELYGIQESYSKKVLSESRKKRILKNLKNPVVIPETKQKSYKVSPGKKSKTNFQGMDKLVGDVKPQKSFKRPQDMWSNGWQGYNYRLSQGKKNIVLEKIGEGKQAWNYMLNHGTTMNAKNLEEFWGKNPDFYSYFFNGKKYRPIRKEQLKGDYIVFLVDEFGVNSSMLQSELNIKLAEEDEKKIIAEYNKLNNIEPISYENDPLFKKVSKRLKKEIDYPDKPAKKGYPNEPPPKLGPDGFHPDFGKRYKYDKLDPISATTMKNAPTGNPEIDANVKKASLKSKVKEEYSDWRNEIGKK